MDETTNTKAPAPTQSDVTRGIAAEVLSQTDPRGWYVNPDLGIMRREYTPTTETERIARSVVDEVDSPHFDSEDSSNHGRDTAIREFARDVMRDDPSMPTAEAIDRVLQTATADDIIEYITARYWKSKKPSPRLADMKGTK